MARRKKRGKRKSKKPRQASRQTLLQRGREAWEHGRTEDVLRLWGRAWDKSPSPELTAALGELLFQRGVRAIATNLPDDDAFRSGMADLERAGEIFSDDERPFYYLGLAHHRLNDLEKAQAFYLRVLELEPNHRRATYHLVLTALEQENDPTQSQGWTLLSTDQKTDLQAAWHLLTKQNKRLRSTEDVHPLWTSLADLDSWRTDKEQTREKLNRILEQKDGNAPRARLARVYLGNLLWPDDPSAAARHWDSIPADSTERVQIAAPPAWVEHNRAVGADFLACQILKDTSDSHTALPFARIALDQAPGQKPYQEVMGHIHLVLGNEIASEERWYHAVKHWETARRLTEESHVLYHNLALGYEHLEQWRDATDAWREYLRRLPRQETASGALTPVQEGRVRRHVASLYLQAGNGRKAFRFYAQALRAPLADEDSIRLYQEFAELLADYKRWRRAERVLRKGIKQHPEHLTLFQALGLLYEKRKRDKKAQRIWEQMLVSFPHDDFIQEQLVGCLVRRADSKMDKLLSVIGHALRRTDKIAEEEGFETPKASIISIIPRAIGFGMQKSVDAVYCKRLNDAIDLYQQALEYAPQDNEIKFDLADLYQRSYHTDKASSLINEILKQNSNNYTLLSKAVRFWLTNGEDERANSLLQRADGWDSDQRATLYVSVGAECYRAKQAERGERLLEQALGIGQAHPTAVIPAVMLLLHEEEYRLAIRLLKQTQKHPPPDKYMTSLLLALAYTFLGNHKQARQIMGKARHVAQQNKDSRFVFLLRELSRIMKKEPDEVLEILDAIITDDELS
ncbi:MAG: tetratricopeptide repeat protein [Proteobacteria bacterium]|nr:tetratricopeptide repeat protein [Pseudomonadota bacterium]